MVLQKFLFDKLNQKSIEAKFTQFLTLPGYWTWPPKGNDAYIIGGGSPGGGDGGGRSSSSSTGSSTACRTTWTWGLILFELHKTSISADLNFLFQFLLEPFFLGEFWLRRFFLSALGFGPGFVTRKQSISKFHVLLKRRFFDGTNNITLILVWKIIQILLVPWSYENAFAGSWRTTLFDYLQLALGAWRIQSF